MGIHVDVMCGYVAHVGAHVWVHGPHGCSCAGTWPTWVLMCGYVAYMGAQWGDVCGHAYINVCPQVYTLYTHTHTHTQYIK